MARKVWMGTVEVHYGADLEFYAFCDTQPRGSSNYGTRSASLLLRLLTQIWRPSPPTNRTFNYKTSLVKTLAIAL
jgi:hypothetical protein